MELARFGEERWGEGRFASMGEKHPVGAGVALSSSGQ